MEGYRGRESGSVGREVERDREKCVENVSPFIFFYVFLAVETKRQTSQAQHPIGQLCGAACVDREHQNL